MCCRRSLVPLAARPLVACPCHRREIREFRIQGRAGLDRALLGFAQDASGEVYALVNFPGVPFGNTGEVLKLVPAGGR